MLWLGLYFPDFALEVFQRGVANLHPSIVVTAHHNRPLALLCNQRAAHFGIKPGISVSAARALAPELIVHIRDIAAESFALSRVAAWAGQFTPSVSLEAPNGVLLEIGESLNLFGGLHRLIARVKQGLQELGYRAQFACAPTPLGAAFFSRARIATSITGIAKLADELARLPIAVLNEPPETLEALQALGVDTLGDCLKLPRDGLARRFGQHLLDDLDRALGNLPDARKFFVPPNHFESKLELLAEVYEAEPLLFAARRLINELCGYLSARGSGITRFDLLLAHANGLDTRLTIGLAATTRDVQHFTVLLREQLARNTLPQPVRALTLIADEIRPLAARNLTWLSDPSQEKENVQHLIERLRARLGINAVQGLSLNRDHRPEFAWQYAEADISVGRALPNKPKSAGDARPTLFYPPRPLWLLAEPRRIESIQDELYLEGLLTLQAGPERIESGWWDNRDATRDYFAASNSRGEKFWIFRERNGERRWFLHGLFA